MIKANNVPRLRFPEFTDAWEERKLGEVSPLRGGYAFQSNKFRGKGIPIVKISNILSTGKVGGDFDYYDELPQDDNFILPDGAAVLAMSGATIGKVSVLSNPKTKVYQNQRVGYFTTKKGVDYTFIKTFVKSSLFTDQLRSVLVSGAQPNVSSKDIDNFKFYFTKSIKEQSKLGAFFNDIDTLITLQQDKIEAIKKYKAGMLQKMFPREGETVPEIRFHGFKEEWEKRKYKDIGTHLSGGTLNYNSLVPDGIYNCVLYGELYTHYDCIIKDIRNKTNSKGNTVQKNDILFPQSTTVDALSLISPACLNVDTAQTSGVFVIRPFSNIDGNFVAYYTKGNQHQRKKLSKKAQGSTIIHLYYQSIKDEIILIPKIEEQRKISQFFQALDNLISFHQREYDKLKELKKGLLQQMFV